MTKIERAASTLRKRNDKSIKAGAKKLVKELKDRSKPLCLDLRLTCQEIEKFYDSAWHAKQACCYEPVALFSMVGRGLGSLPMFGARFVPGKRYRIRVEEL